MHCRALGGPPSCAFRRVGPTIKSVASLSGVSYLPQRPVPASTWMTGVDFPDHLQECLVQILPFRSLDALVGGIFISCPHIGGLDERNVPPSPSQTVKSTSPMIAVQKVSLLNLGLTTLIGSEFFSKSPIFNFLWLSTAMNLLSSFVISNPAFSQTHSVFVEESSTRFARLSLDRHPCQSGHCRRED